MNRRAVFWIAAAVLLLFVIWQAARGTEIARLGAAFYAKTLCSGMFVSGREAEAVIDEDVRAGIPRGLKLFWPRIEQSKGLVTVSLLGAFSSTALHREGLGCTLLNGRSAAALRAAARGVSRERPAPPVDQPWPRGRAVAKDRFDPAVLRVVDAAFAETAEAPRRTRAVVVVQGGRIIAERYAAGITPETPLAGWSMAKSVVNALVGIAVGEGRLDLAARDLFPDWRDNDERRRITPAHLLRMTSGLDFDGADRGPLTGTRRMLYLEADSAAYAMARPMAAAPGGKWVYASGNTSLLCALLKRAAGTRGEYSQGLAFPRRALFGRIGMHSAVFETDAVNSFMGAAFLFASARDWARLGLLYLQDGVWSGERILPQGWVRGSREPTAGSDGAYGAHLWLRVPGFLRPPEAPRRRLPDDAFFMLGIDGQMVAIVSSRALVAVRLGLSRDPAAWDHEAFVADLLAKLPER